MNILRWYFWKWLKELPVVFNNFLGQWYIILISYEINSIVTFFF